MASTTQKVRVAIQKGLENVACRVYRGTDQNDLTDNTWMKINLNTKSYDLGGNFNTTTFKFIAPITGLYRIHAKIHFTTASVVAEKTYAVGFYLNAALKSSSYEHIGASTDEVSVETTEELYLAVNAEIEMYAKVIAGVSTVDVLSGENFTSLTIRLITKEGIRQ